MKLGAWTARSPPKFNVRIAAAASSQIAVPILVVALLVIWLPGLDAAVGEPRAHPHGARDERARSRR